MKGYYILLSNYKNKLEVLFSWTKTQISLKFTLKNTLKQRGNQN